MLCVHPKLIDQMCRGYTDIHGDRHAEKKTRNKKYPGGKKAGAGAGVSQSKITLQADTLYDFDKATLKPEGKATLDKIAKDLSKIKLEVIIAVGNTDSVGTDAYNMALGQRRAQSVKAYLVSKGVDGSRIYTESKGKSNPVASNATAEGRAKNRRTDIEVVGTAAVK